MLKRKIAHVRFLILSLVSVLLPLAVRAEAGYVAVIANESLTVDYYWDELHKGTCTLSEESDGNPEHYYYSPPIEPCTLTAAARPGMTFKGWYTLAKNDTDYFSTSVSLCTSKLTDDLSITASMITKLAKTSACLYAQYVVCPKYEYIPLSVTFNGNGATSGKTDAVTGKNYDSEFNLPVNGFVRTGYVFGGWSNRVGKVFSDGARVKGSDFWDEEKWDFESELFAMWTNRVYTITCDPAGSGPASATFEEVFPVSDPTRTGYEFKGWKVEEADFSTARYGSSEASVNATLTSETVCLGADGKTWFRRLNSTGGSVRLVAQFKARTYTVTFSNMGGSGGPTSMSVTYDEKTKDVSNVPTKDGNKFMGYDINGILYWDANGLHQKEKWDIPSDCTAYARWEAKTFHVEYDANGGSGTIYSQFCTNGVATTLSDGSGFSRLGCKLLGWSTSQSAAMPEYGLGGTYSLDFTANTTLFAIWEVSYSIGFDGFGATSGTMEPQKFKNGEEKELTRNAYVKTGYSFGGWAKDEVGARALTPTYKDGQMFTGAVDVPGSTNWLYAVWNTNAYHVAFDANGGTGPLPKTIDCLYDHPVTIPAPSADLVKPPFVFSGWRDPVSDVVYADLPVIVSNLCVTADGTNTLSAVWRLSDLSEAMHCTNLYWTSADDAGTNPWTVQSGPEVGYGPSGSCVRQTGQGAYADQQRLVAELGTSGALSFKWRGSRLKILICEASKTDLPGVRNWFTLQGDGQTWETFTTNIVFEAEANVVRILNYGTDGQTAEIDQMTWTPCGPQPGPENEVTISSAAVSDGKFTLSFTSDARFDYNLLTNANLLIDSWGVMTNEVGTGKTISFETQIIEGQPQMFYRVDTIQKE